VGKLIYSGITSLDGYIADENGSFDWGMPSEDVHAAVNDFQRSIGTYLYGRDLYEVLSAWETIPLENQSAVIVDYANIWRAANKVVYSHTLVTPVSERTRIESEFDPETVATMKADSGADLLIGGANIGAQALAAGLVDEIHQYLAPVIVGGGKRFVPPGLQLHLALIDERTFSNGMVQLSYEVLRPVD
jgi:dihydrofolate reductase